MQTYINIGFLYIPDSLAGDSAFLDAVEQLAEYVDGRHRFLYANEQLYEYEDGVYRPVQDHQVESYISSAAPKFGLRPRSIKRNMKGDMLDEIKSSNFIKSSELAKRSPPNLIAFKNGYINIDEVKEGRTLLHQFDAEEGGPIFLNMVPHNFNISIPITSALDILYRYAPMLYGSFEASLGKDAILKQLQKIGYIFYRSNPYKSLFVEIGERDTGKTTNINIITELIGRDNISFCSMQDISNNTFARADLYGKLANIYDDMGNSVVYNLGLLKMISGNSPISAKMKYKQSSLIFDGYIKMIFATNEYPKLASLGDEAFFSRIIVTNYVHKFKRDESVKDMLSHNEAEMEALIVASVQALRELIAGKGFAEQDRGFVEEWKRQTNPIYRFISDMLSSGRIVRDANGTVPKDTFYSVYQGYMEDNAREGEVVLKKNTLTACLETYGIFGDRQGQKQIMVYRGIRLMDGIDQGAAVPSGAAAPVPGQKDLASDKGRCHVCGSIFDRKFMLYDPASDEDALICMACARGKGYVK